jgi:hypothetical protein
VRYDDDAICIGARMYGEHPERILRSVRGDVRHARDEVNGGREYQYDPVWKASASVDSLLIENRDLNVLSFRSNVVLRREWHAESTLFVV